MGTLDPYARKTSRSKAAQAWQSSLASGYKKGADSALTTCLRPSEASNCAKLEVKAVASSKQVVVLGLQSSSGHPEWSCLGRCLTFLLPLSPTKPQQRRLWLISARGAPSHLISSVGKWGGLARHSTIRIETMLLRQDKGGRLCNRPCGRRTAALRSGLSQNIFPMLTWQFMLRLLPLGLAKAKKQAQENGQSHTWRLCAAGSLQLQLNLPDRGWQAIAPHS